MLYRIPRRFALRQALPHSLMRAVLAPAAKAAPITCAPWFPAAFYSKGARVRWHTMDAQARISGFSSCRTISNHGYVGNARFDP
jgi:hypothetical protein